MKNLKTMIAALALTLMASFPAYAASGYVDTSRTYSSGILIGLFLGFCALIVVMQLIPSIIMLVSFVKQSLANRKPKRQVVGVR